MMLKKEFKLENPHIEIDEVKIPELDAQIMADEMALSLERFGPLKFKVTAYRTLQRIIKAGALGVEIRMSGKLPGARAKLWKFSQGYLKRTGESSRVVDKAYARAETKPGTVGVKVAILPPNADLQDKIVITDEIIAKLKENALEPVAVKKKATRKKATKKVDSEEKKE